MPCDECYAIHLKKGLETPCARCPKPVLMENNSLAWELFCHLSTQIVSAGFGGVTGFNLQALDILFRLYEVPEGEQKLVFDKIHVLSRTFLKQMSAKAEEERKRKAT